MTLSPQGAGSAVMHGAVVQSGTWGRISPALGLPVILIFLAQGRLWGRQGRDGV